MAEILLMKSLKTLIAFICYFGTGVILIDQAVEGAVKEALNLNPAAQTIIMYLLILFWIIKIAWFIIDKRINVQERKLEMKRTEEEIIDLRENHKK